MDNIGRVESVRSEICIVSGLIGVGLSNVVSFSSGGQGIVFGFERDRAQIVMMNDYSNIKKGDLVRVTDDSVKTFVSDKLLGRVIDPLGKPLDGRGEIDSIGGERHSIEAAARPVYQRAFVDKSILSGVSIIDSQIPVGKGQRELLLGERNTGMTDMGISIIMNQAKLNTGTISIYVVIDGETAQIKRRIQQLTDTGALANSVVIFGRSAAPAAVNYIAPMVGATIAEFFSEQGKDVLVVYDNLTSHAKVYRQLSLLLNRPASREAYPGDVFYLHSRLLERSGAFNKLGGEGTITALPIVETPTEDATDYITTNLMSITDGHILFRQALVNKGVQPAIDSGFSVSRIGNRIQSVLLRDVSEGLKEIMVRFAEIERFLAFGSDLNADSLELYELGRRAMSIFNQMPDDCRSTIQTIVLIYFVTSKIALNWDFSQIEEVTQQLLEYLTQPPHNRLVTDLLLPVPLEKSAITLDEFFKDFMKQPTTLKPLEKSHKLIAETETISSILRDNEEMINNEQA